MKARPLPRDGRRRRLGPRASVDVVEQVPLRVPARWLRRFAGRALRSAVRAVPGPWPTTVELAILSVGPARIRDLSGRHLGKRRVTDVLSFPLQEPLVPGPLLGDVVICPSRARANAERAGRSYRSEIAVLTIHGVLHLLGFDHERDDGTMRSLEHAVRRDLGLVRLGDPELL